MRSYMNRISRNSSGRRWHRLKSFTAHLAQLLAISDVTICFSYMFRYMILTIGPLPALSLIKQISLTFRMYFELILNPQHAFFGGCMI